MHIQALSLFITYFLGRQKTTPSTIAIDKNETNSIAQRLLDLWKSRPFSEIIDLHALIYQ